eukprot:CAMPEP_0171672832 /NCGR_PEP_ID=MMETSP0990-20121206/52215_1 /TAXON_ID=483369 /ORGANISM="non described non described, Strain CCMP2098" /LENGTH=99 /DNA_ID=CAMNT_0012258179 /DNA_START=245 /DNA_END=544 /DNA_ORIENTATION=-
MMRPVRLNGDNSAWPRMGDLLLGFLHGYYRSVLQGAPSPYASLSRSSLRNARTTALLSHIPHAEAPRCRICEKGVATTRHRREQWRGLADLEDDVTRPT